MSWFLRSTSDRDTHRGELHPDGTVVAQCGIRSEPLPLPFDRIALPGHPPDRDQVCPRCRDRAAVAARGAR
ncbi:MAG: hypothetical protein ACRDRP_22050 [Pseudonocardiaceae bacterium]